MTNPLEIPEIVFLIGKFVPVWWKGVDDHYNHRFNPKKMLTCCLVSRTWRSSMLPWLWVIFDERFMTNVPGDVLLKYSAYFKFVEFINSGHILSSALTQSNGLRSIRMDQWDTNAVPPLLNSHPGLRHLTLHITDTSIGPSITHSLSNLQNLTELEIRDVAMTFTDLLAILKNKPRLQTLSLCSVEIEDRPSKHSPGPGPTSLTVLHILSRKIDIGVIRRLLECSPALRSFSIDLDCQLEYPFGASDISSALRENCPNLESLFVTGDFDDVEVDRLIDMTSPLVKEISIGLDYLDGHTLRAIARAKAVEKLTLRAADIVENGLERILSCCCRLKELHITFDPLNDDPDKFIRILCDKPWSSTDLTRFSIRGLLTKGWEMLPQELQGYKKWNLSPTDNLYSRNLGSFLKYEGAIAARPWIPHADSRLLAALGQMPHVWEVIVNELKYRRVRRRFDSNA